MPTIIAVFATLTGTFLWMHIALALSVRFAVRRDQPAINALFAPASSTGLILFRSYLMRVKLFFPWITAEHSKNFPKPLRTLIWSARLAGTGLIISFLFMIGAFVYFASTGA
jgi:hypothetical protein